MATAKKPPKEDLDFQIDFFEGILRRHPDYVDVLVVLGEVYTRKGFYQKGLKVDKKLSRLRPDNPIVHYNLACSFSLLGELSKSFQAIERAISLGYEDIAFMCKDPDLSNLRQDERFEGLVQKAKRRKRPQDVSDVSTR